MFDGLYVRVAEYQKEPNRIMYQYCGSFHVLTRNEQYETVILSTLFREQCYPSVCSKPDDKLMFDFHLGEPRNVRQIFERSLKAAV